jgi:hypothetical protein
MYKWPPLFGGISRNSTEDRSLFDERSKEPPNRVARRQRLC